MAGTQTVSVYLLKPEIETAAHALKEEHMEGMEEHSLDAGDTLGTLYVSEGEESPPDWVKFLAEATDPPVTYQSKSVSAVLLLKASDRMFAITFGYGRRLLDPDSYERDFGLLCAMNSVDPAKLRGAEARTFDEFALHTLRQISRLSTIGSLEIDTNRELVVSMEGQLEDPEMGKRIDGRDAVRITAELTPDELQGKCAELLRQSRRKDYRTRFPFFDTIKKVRDPVEVRRLEQRAMNALGQHRLSEFDLFPPQIVTGDIVAFEYSLNGRSTRVLEPHSGLLSSVLRGPQPPHQVRSKLERVSLKGLDGNGDVVDAWSFFRCLHWEHNDGGAVFVLDGGQWYRIEPNLVAEVESFAASLNSSGIAWPAATGREKEGEYNTKASASLDFALLDAKHLIRLPGQTPVEPCDLFSAQLQFVHVKKRKGGSAPLSHLFMQAVVSAEGFVKEENFRQALCRELEKAKPGFGIYSPDQIRTRDYQIVLAMIAKPGTRNIAEGLPFFSKVTLRLAVMQLTSMNFEVRVDTIPIKEVVPTGIPPKRGKGRRTRRKVSGPTSAQVSAASKDTEATP